MVLADGDSTTDGATPLREASSLPLGGQRLAELLGGSAAANGDRHFFGHVVDDANRSGEDSSRGSDVAAELPTGASPGDGHRPGITDLIGERLQHRIGAGEGD